jgi:hypothetical protein
VGGILEEEQLSELTSDDLRTMLVEIMTKRAPSLRSPEADAKRERLQQQCDEIVARGGTVEIPPEIEV